MTKTRATAQKVLLTFVGTHDPYRGEVAGTGDGPVLSLLQVQGFDAVHIFYNNLTLDSLVSRVKPALTPPL